MDKQIKIYVGGLSYYTTEPMLKQHFAKIGPVADVHIITDRFTGESRGFGFVFMSEESSAEQAITTLNGTDLDGKSIMVKIAREREAREPKEESKTTSRELDSSTKDEQTEQSPVE